ncbi:hypothetical protein Csa_023123 [Cucumis sativus]|nr:hypothetical protein Csa_023123 [Cucumis sativus]
MGLRRLVVLQKGVSPGSSIVAGAVRFWLRGFTLLTQPPHCRGPVEVGLFPVTQRRRMTYPYCPMTPKLASVNLDQALNQRGIELMKPNETCDVVYCYCGIRLHPLSCPEAFSLNQNGILEGNRNVKRLERNCLSSGNVNGFPGLGGCSKCLKSLYQVRKLQRACLKNPVKAATNTVEYDNFQTLALCV